MHTTYDQSDPRNTLTGLTHRYTTLPTCIVLMHQKKGTVAQRMFGFIFTQMSAWAGIKKHGQAARDALTAEFAQLDYNGAYELIHATDLTKTQQTSALRIINLIKEKQNGQLKGRSVTDGWPQHALYKR